MMNVYVCTDHDAFWPVGACSIVVAESEFHAGELLHVALKTHGLNPDKGFTLRKLNVETSQAFILLDGQY